MGPQLVEVTAEEVHEICEIRDIHEIREIRKIREEAPVEEDSLQEGEVGEEGSALPRRVLVLLLMVQLLTLPLQLSDKPLHHLHHLHLLRPCPLHLAPLQVDFLLQRVDRHRPLHQELDRHLLPSVAGVLQHLLHPREADQ